MLFFLYSILIQSQTSIDFDSFTLGDVSPQSSIIEKWPDPTANPTDAQVSDDYSNSAPNSLLIRPQTGGIEDDILINLGNKNLGVWEIKFMMYVPTGHNGYFNIQEYESIDPTSQWNGEFYVGSTTSGGSAGVVSHNNLSGTASFPHDTWFEIILTVDLDNQEITATIDNNMMLNAAPYQDNNGNTSFQVGGVDFYSSDANTKFYIDDFEFYETCIEPTISGVSTPPEICPGNSVVLSVATNGEEINWYDQPTGGTIIGSGMTFTTPPLNQPTSFWIESRNTTGTGLTCSPARTEVAINVIEEDLPVGEENQDFEPGEKISDLEVTGDNLTWYNDDELTNKIPVYTNLVDGKTYYVTQTGSNSGCESKALAITVEETLSLNDKKDIQISFYPNPVQNSLNIEINNGNNYNAVILNFEGKEVISKNNLIKNSRIDISGLTSGIYFMKIYLNQNSKVFKVIKN
ncbi:T9SS type A sorting domain-containing protein [Mesonia maritima]